MSVLSKKLHVMKTGGADIAISLYTTAGECAEPNLKLLVDGTQAYAKLGSVSDSNATPLRVYRNSDKETYAVLKEAETVYATMGLTVESLSIMYESTGYYAPDGMPDYSQGALTPNTFVYNGVTYRIMGLYSERSELITIQFASNPEFTRITLEIDGTKITVQKNYEWIFDCASSYKLEDGKKYTVKIVDIA